MSELVGGGAEFGSGLVDEDDLPAPAAASGAGWSENFWWIGHDGDRGLGLMVHHGSLAHDFGLLRQTVLVFLPEGTVVADVSIATRGDGPGVVGATATQRCVVPFREWSLSCRGVGQRSSAAELFAGGVQWGPKVPLQFDILAECLTPVWSAAGESAHERIDAQAWAHSHYQQTVRLTGSIRVGDEEFEIGATGLRDHSRGPRDFTGWTGHVLASAPFPSGRAFGVTRMYGPGHEPVFDSAYVAGPESLSRGRAGPIPPLTERVLTGESFDFQIDVDGRSETISCRTGAPAFLSLIPPNEVIPGIGRTFAGSVALCEVLATYTWNGEVGYGILERSTTAADLGATNG